MAYDEYLADRVRNSLKIRGANFFDKKMMGGLIFMVNEKMFMGIDINKKTGESRIMARIGPEASELAMGLPGCREMDFTGKVMKGYVYVYPEGFDMDDDLEAWIDRAMEFNKVAKKSKKRK